MGKAKEEFDQHVIDVLHKDLVLCRDKFTEQSNLLREARKLVLVKVTVKTWVTLALGYAALALVMCLLVAGIVWSLRWILQGLGVL